MLKTTGSEGMAAVEGSPAEPAAPERAGAGARFAFQAHGLPRGLPRTTRDLPVRSGGGDSGLVSTEDAADKLQGARDARPGRAGGQPQFRVNTGADISAMLAAKKISEKDLKAAISLALTRMQKEKLLLVPDPIVDIMKRLFPAPGKFDEAELAKVVDVKDRSRVYMDIADTESTIKASDKPKLKATMDDAAKLIDGAMADSTGLTQVFGSKDADAKRIYGQAKAALLKVKGDMDASLDTDYNRDDEQIGLGGWASFGSQFIHLTRKVAEVLDAKQSQIIIIHECAHLADGSVRDKGYYGTSGFEGLKEAIKITNAAHFEELPARALGISKYPGVTFTPGSTASGGAETFEDKVRRDASEFLRKAWDSGVNAHQYIRSLRMDHEAGDDRNFKANKKGILRLSKLAHLTIHKQKKPKAPELIDVVLMEGVTRATSLIIKGAKAVPVEAKPKKGKKKKDYVRKLINDAVRAYGALTGAHASDMELMQYLVRHYKKGF